MVDDVESVVSAEDGGGAAAPPPGGARGSAAPGRSSFEANARRRLSQATSKVLAHHPDREGEKDGLAALIEHGQLLKAGGAATLGGMARGYATGASATSSALDPSGGSAAGGSMAMRMPRKGRSYDLEDPSALGRLRGALRATSGLDDEAFGRVFAREDARSRKAGEPFSVGEKAFALTLDEPTRRALEPRAWGPGPAPDLGVGPGTGPGGPGDDGPGARSASRTTRTAGRPTARASDGGMGR